MAELVNQTDLARRLGVSETAVRKHIARGLYRAERDGRFNVEKCKAAWEVSRDPDAVLKGIAGGQAVSGNKVGGGMQESSLVKARAAREIVAAKRQHLALQKEQGELIRTEDAYRACRAVVTIVLERLDGAAAQIGPRVVGLDAAAAELVAREVLNAVRTEIAGMSAAIKEIADGAG